MPRITKKNFMREQKKDIDNDKVFQVRTRFTVAEINAGATFVPAIPGYKYRLVDVSMIAIGGAAGGATDVRLLATQAGASVALLIAAVAALTQNTLARAGAANMTVLAAGASFVANDVNTAITISKTGGALGTATHIDVLMQYTLDQAIG